MAFYESIIIIRPDLTAEQVEAVNRRVADLVAANKGQILRTELWGRRQLAYPIKKNTKGYYVFNLLEGGGPLVHELEARLKIDEDVIKYQNVRVETASQTPSPLSPSAIPPAREGEVGAAGEDPGRRGGHRFGGGRGMPTDIPENPLISDDLDEDGDK
ncbi:MAG: 30S ribosomal protein S6 [Magnetococcales bacterium]|nr:30S ribosomal protein S6 [Magnetococcales bacterium]MBF0156643.1 30S ribosomal protein S6 [Magnetococcales bacterium]